MLDEELVEKICKLGLTTKQAKIYTSIVTSKPISVAEISKKTGLHEQDIYKILPKLEKIGLVTRTITKPIKVETIPVEKALKSLIQTQQQKVKSQKKNAQEIIEAIKKSQVSLPQREEGKFTILPGGSDARKNRVELAFENARKALDLFTTEELFPESFPFLVGSFFDKLTMHRVKIRILIKMHNKENNLMDIISKVKLPAVNLTVKCSGETGQLYYAIMDDKEVWIPLEFLADAAVLVTDNKSVVQICKECFEKTWKDPETKTLFQQEGNKTL